MKLGWSDILISENLSEDPHERNKIQVKRRKRKLDSKYMILSSFVQIDGSRNLV